MKTQRLNEYRNIQYKAIYYIHSTEKKPFNREP